MHGSSVVVVTGSLVVTAVVAKARCTRATSSLATTGSESLLASVCDEGNSFAMTDPSSRVTSMVAQPTTPLSFIQLRTRFSSLSRSVVL